MTGWLRWLCIALLAGALAAGAVLLLRLVRHLNSETSGAAPGDSSYLALVSVYGNSAEGITGPEVASIPGSIATAYSAGGAVGAQAALVKTTLDAAIAAGDDVGAAGAAARPAWTHDLTTLQRLDAVAGDPEWTQQNQPVCAPSARSCVEFPAWVVVTAPSRSDAQKLMYKYLGIVWLSKSTVPTPTVTTG